MTPTLAGWRAPGYEKWGYAPLDYEPEKWDVVRSDGVMIIAGTTILDADTQVAWLNARRRAPLFYQTSLHAAGDSDEE